MIEGAPELNGHKQVTLEKVAFQDLYIELLELDRRASEIQREAQRMLADVERQRVALLAPVRAQYGFTDDPLTFERASCTVTQSSSERRP